MSEHPEEDALITSLDGKQLDVMIDIDQEIVTMVIDGLGQVALTPQGARRFADQLVSATGVFGVAETG
jgi:hypothetical protein